MKRRLALAFLIVLAAVFLAPAAEAPKGFDAFRLLRTRNVFDPERRPLPIPGVPAPRTDTKATPSDYVALTGIMVTSDKALAFFSGSRSDYSRVLPVNGEIAGAKVTKITPAHIEVERNGKTINVAVGETVPLDNSTTPTATPVAAPVETSTPPSDSAPATTGANAPNPPPANVSDALRRMMERRQQELK